VERNLARIRAETLSINFVHALAADGLRQEHADPFDWILAAQVLLEGCHS
jgi:PIN domain nuclease of toxin-antitoxin system